MPWRKGSRRLCAALVIGLLLGPAPWPLAQEAVAAVPVRAPAAAQIDGLLATRQGPVTILHAPADAGFARAVATLAAARHEQIRRDLGLRGRVEVALLLLTAEAPASEREEWERRLPRWLAGAAIARERFIVLRVKRGQTPRELEPLLAHELTHVILRADFPRSDDWPLWFQEGLAMRESRTEGLQEYGALAYAALRGRVLPLGTLRHRFPDTEAGSRLAYAQSYSFLAHLVGTHGRERFAQLLVALREEPFDEGFTRVYGSGPWALEREWLRWVNRHYAWIPLLTGGTAFSALMVALFFLAVGVRRRKSRLMRERWEEEEREEGEEEREPSPN